ncbi:MAG: hypothetical protein CL862_07190 [Cyanobium sp. NAT70]|nr:hypothetical protein [Cyanobium sp. NAT70]|tara:strand:- start:155 stop:433 length:279 start_codon:yes stop_codon:yes gene_type:complete
MKDSISMQTFKARDILSLFPFFSAITAFIIAIWHLSSNDPIVHSHGYTMLSASLICLSIGGVCATQWLIFLTQKEANNITKPDLDETLGTLK